MRSLRVSIHSARSFVREVVCYICFSRCVIVVAHLRNVWPAISKVAKQLAKWTIELHVGGVVCDLTWSEPGVQHGATETTLFIASKVQVLSAPFKEGLRLFLSVLKGEGLAYRKGRGYVSNNIKGCQWVLLGLALLQDYHLTTETSAINVFAYLLRATVDCDFECKVADIAGGGMLERKNELYSRCRKHAIAVVNPLSRRLNLTQKCDAQKLKSITDCLRHIMARVDNDPAKFWKAQAQLWPKYVELPGEADRGVLDTLRNAQPSVVPTGGPPLQNPQALGAQQQLLVRQPSTAAAAVAATAATHGAAASAGAAEADTIGMVGGHWQVGCLPAGWSGWRRTGANAATSAGAARAPGRPTVTDATRAALQPDPATGAIHAATDPSSPHQWNRIPCCQHILGLRYSSSHRRRQCRLSSRRHRHPGPPEKQQQPQTPLPHPTQPAQQQPLPVGIPPLISQ